MLDSDKCCEEKQKRKWEVWMMKQRKESDEEGDRGGLTQKARTSRAGE